MARLGQGKNPETGDEIQWLLSQEKSDILEDRLRNRIEFGTAGLRGRMQAGFSHMNTLTVIQTSQGLAQYVLDMQPDAKHAGVVIGFDTRHNSHLFAELAATAFIAKGIKVYWFGEYVATPLVSFAVRWLKAAAGVMITASHNPKQDNGYKVYWSGGCQINSPHDTGIRDRILSNLGPWRTAWGTEVINNDNVVKSLETILPAYMDAIKCLALRAAGPRQSYTSNVDIPEFVYTPLHGVGHKFFQPLGALLGFKDRMNTVPEQLEPDADFPTVDYPNPEVNYALDRAKQLADARNIKLIVANDPDADRFSVAERLKDRWHQFTGDQIGILLATHLQPMYRSPYKMLTTAVSSEMLVHSGIPTEETLTGFKWLGNRARELEQRKGTIVPFAYEEAIGFMFSEVSYDKDGLSAAAVFLLAVAKWRNEGSTPYTKLQQLYDAFGYHETLNTSFPSDKVTTNATFGQLRAIVKSWDETGREQAVLGRYSIDCVRDVTEGSVWLRNPSTTWTPGSLPRTKDVHMITYWLSEGPKDDRLVRFTLRASGTEPKVKLYLEVRARMQEEAISIARSAFKAICDCLLRQSGSLCENYERYEDGNPEAKILTSSGAIVAFPRFSNIAT